MARWQDYEEKQDALQENDELIINSGGIVKRVQAIQFRGDQGLRGIGISRIESRKTGKNTFVEVFNTENVKIGSFTIQDGVDGNDGENGADGAPGVDGTDGENGVGIVNILSTKSGKITTLIIELSNGKNYEFSIQDGIDGTGAGDMLSENNLSDLLNKTEARRNLNVYSKSQTDSRIDEKIREIPEVDLRGVAKLSGGNMFSGEQKIKGENIFLKLDNISGGASGIRFQKGNQDFFTTALLSNNNLVFSRFVNGEWVDDAININNSNGNIGIGVNNPKYKLEVPTQGQTQGLDAVIGRVGFIQEGNGLPGGISSLNAGYGLGFYAPSGPISFFTAGVEAVHKKMEIGYNGDLIINGQNITGEWQDFVPTFYMGQMVGVQVTSARYKIIGKTAFVNIRFNGVLSGDCQEFGFDGLPFSWRYIPAPNGWIYNYGNGGQGIIIANCHPRDAGAKLITSNYVKNGSNYDIGISITGEIV